MLSGAPTERELRVAHDWFEEHLIQPQQSDDAPLPLSFSYGGTPASPQTWQPSAAGAAGSERSIVFTHTESGLQVRLEATCFEDFPAVEWVMHLKNTGDSDTAIIADILPLDITLPLPGETEGLLHWAKGSECKLDDFAPQETPLRPGGAAHLGTHGRSSSGMLPFFNLQLGEQGVIAAIGWTGGWKADITRDGDGAVHLQAGMQKTHLKLLPGEEIRSPRILLLFWQGEPLHGQNMLRQFILAHHTPQRGRRADRGSHL